MAAPTPGVSAAPTTPDGPNQACIVVFKKRQMEGYSKRFLSPTLGKADEGCKAPLFHQETMVGRFYPMTSFTKIH